MAYGFSVFWLPLSRALGYRVPPSGWKPAGWTPPAAQAANTMITQRHVHVKKVWAFRSSGSSGWCCA